jgi:hypothetical protein
MRGLQSLEGAAGARNIVLGLADRHLERGVISLGDAIATFQNADILGAIFGREIAAHCKGKILRQVRDHRID